MYVREGLTQRKPKSGFVMHIYMQQCIFVCVGYFTDNVFGRALGPISLPRESEGERGFD